LAQSLTKSSASLVAAGGDLAEAAALTATANAIIQDADAVGTALKTTSLRLRGTEVSVLEEEGVDSDGAVASKSKLQSKVKALSGVDILTETGDYKSTYEILSQIADVWEDISNMDQAALLELLAGKRNASVLAAILQSPEQLKEAYEDANNAAGSAWEENEKYLDSIQGKIDQFNNAMQTLWSNILDDDMVKGIVEWVTKIVKSLDTTQGKVLTIVKAVALLMAYKKVNPLDWIPKMGTFFAQFSGKGFKGSISIIGQYLAQLIGIAPAMKTITAETIANTVATQTNNTAEQQAILQKMGLTGATGALNAEKKEEIANNIALAVTNGQMTVQMGQQMAAMLGYTLSVDAAGKATVALDATTKSFMATNPVGWILLIVSAVMALVMWLGNTKTGAEKLREELSDLKSELQDIKSEIDSVNSELETTQERMAELLAKDSLSFVEQEELDRLKKENDELQRKLDLLDLQNKQKSKEAAKKFAETMTNDENAGDDRYYVDGSKANWFSDLGLRMSEQPVEYLSESKTIDLKIEQYKKYAEEFADLERQIIAAGGEETDIGKELKKEKDKIDTEMSAIETYITDKQDQWIKDSEGIEYFTGDNLEDWQIESNKWLDMINNTQDKWAIASDGDNAMSNAIKSVFGREEFSDESDQINKYVKDLKSGDTSAKKSIEGIINSNADLKNALAAKGLDPEDAISYFTDLSSTSAFDTLKGKIAEVSEAATNFEKLLKGDSFKVDGVDTGLAGLFDEEGKIIQTKLSQVFQNTSDQTRAEITKLLEGSYDMIADGLDDSEINYLMNRLGLSFSRAILEIEETNLANKNLELFPGLKDEISGIIDTFSELTSAVGSVVDALDTLDQARAEEAYSGSMSLETLEALMQSTDNYADLIEVDETGAIHLAANAQEVLVAQKLEAIKQNAELALKEAELTYQEALHNEQTYSQTGPAQEFMRGLWNEVGGAMSFVSSLWGDLTSGNWSGAWDRAKTAQEATVTKKETDYANKAAAASAAVADAAKKVENAEKMNKIAQGLTPENVKARYSADEASGGADDPEEVAENAFKTAMDYWENRIAANQARYEQLQNEIDLLESKGQKADASYYEEQIKLENERLSLLKQQKAEAQNFLGTFTEGSEEWWEVANTLNDIEGELDSVTQSIVDLQDAIGEIDTYKFEEFGTRLDNLISKLGTIRDLIAPDGEENWFDDEGNWTEEGVAVLGSYVQELEFYKQGLEETRAELNKYNKAYSNNTKAYYESLGIHSEQEYYEKVEELTEQQYDFAESISDTEQSIVDMYESNIDAVEEYIETLIEGYNDYIDSVKEALDAERDLYEFKKNVQKQSKDIAELERRIASLSGSTNKSEIAERRKLEAQLYEARESLNDTYYDHSKDAQSEALDAEQSAYEETMNKFIEGLRIGLETATRNMDEFLMSVTGMVTLNADAVLAKYQETELPLSDAITNPWEAAKAAVGDYSGDALELMNTWAQNGFLTTFPETVKKGLKSPWEAGQTAAGVFESSVGTVMSNVVKTIETNVKTASSKSSALYKQIEDTEKRAANVSSSTGSLGSSGGGSSSGSSGSGGSGGSGGGNTQTTEKPKELTEAQKIAAKIVRFGSAQGRGMNAGKKGDNGVITWNGKEYNVQNAGNTFRKGANLYKAAVEHLKFGDRQIFGYDGKIYGYLDGAIQEIEGRFWSKKGYNDFVAGVKANYASYAKGTTGTTRDQWAITDEPQFGDELVLVPGKDGNLSFMRKGTGVVPADMTQKLFELAQIPTSDLMKKNITAIVPDITKTDISNQFNFDSLVHVDHCDQNTLKDLEKMVDNKINDFSKQMNYSLKKFTR